MTSNPQSGLLAYQRNEARISSEKSSGCSRAAKRSSSVWIVHSRNAHAEQHGRNRHGPGATKAAATSVDFL